MRQSKSSTTQIRRRTFAKGTLAAVVGLSLSTGSAAAAEELADLVICPAKESIGSVSITEENGLLTVIYTISDEEYQITETHLHVAEDADDIPTNRPGNPRVDHFDHSSEHEEGTDSAAHEIDVSELGDELVIAAQARVRTEIEDEGDGDQETADGDEEEGDGGNGEEGEIGTLETDGANDTDGGADGGEEAGDDGEEEEPEYEYEDAWADGERINQRRHPRHGHYLGSWATYVTYQRSTDE